MEPRPFLNKPTNYRRGLQDCVNPAISTDERTPAHRIVPEQHRIPATIPMFADRGDLELARLLQTAAFRDYPAKSILLEEGPINDALDLIRKGTVQFIHCGKHPVTVPASGAQPFPRTD
jgi:hypothetical protein